MGFIEFSDLVGNSDDKREGPFEQENNGSHLSEDIDQLIGDRSKNLSTRLSRC